MAGAAARALQYEYKAVGVIFTNYNSSNVQ